MQRCVVAVVLEFDRSGVLSSYESVFMCQCQDDGIKRKPRHIVSQSDHLHPGVWYEQAVSWVILHKVTSGCATTMFCPHANLTRQQFVTTSERETAHPRCKMDPKHRTAFDNP